MISKKIALLGRDFILTRNGDLFSTDNLVKYKDGRNPKIFKGRKLKSGTHDKGYVVFSIKVNQVSKKFYAHRLIAKAFIPNPQNKKEVNHINGVKNDNRIENLEWVTSSENKYHAWSNNLNRNTVKQREAAKRNQKKSTEKRSLPVIHLESGTEFKSLTDAGLFFKISGNAVKYWANKGMKFKYIK